MPGLCIHKGPALMLIALSPSATAFLRLSASLVTSRMGILGSVLAYQAAATLIALSFLSFGDSPGSALMNVCLQQSSQLPSLRQPTDSRCTSDCKGWHSGLPALSKGAGASSATQEKDLATNSQRQRQCNTREWPRD